MPDVVTVRIKGIDKLLKGLDIAPQLLEDESRKAMQKSVTLAQGLIASRIKLGPGREGHLRNLITSKVIGPPIRGLIDGDKFTAAWVEFGTKPHVIKEPGGSGHGWGLLVIHHPGAKAKHPFRRGFGAAKQAIKAYFLSAATETVRKIAQGG